MVVSNALVDYLRERIAEEEADALRVVNAPDCTYLAEWHSPSSGIIDTGDRDDLITHDRRLDDHITRWDPARVLAEVAAKRKRIDLILAEDHAECAAPWYTCPLLFDADGESRCADDKAGTACTCGLDVRRGALLRIEAIPYSGRADFLPEWKEQP